MSVAVAATTPLVYDPFSEAFKDDPFPVYRRMRDEAPVYYNPTWDFWALSRYEDCRRALRDTETFINHPGIDLDATNDQGGAGNLPIIDNPRHDELRAVVQRQFMPRSIAELEGSVRRLTHRLVDSFARRGSVDLAQELSWPLPYEVFFDFLGLPYGEERDQLIAWSHGLKDRLPDDDRLTPHAVECTEHSRVYLSGLLEERRRRPRQDLLTHIVQSDVAGVPFAQEHIEPASEIVGFVFGLYLAGIETTAALISTLFQELAARPDQQQALHRDPSLIPAAVEEGLRFRTPLQLTVRHATREVEIHGQRIPAGARVAMVIGAANHDDRRFERPEEYDALRAPIPHLGFGEGLHGCLGNPLARLEARVALEVALSRLGEFRISGPVVRYPSTPNMAVLDHLPLAFAPETAAPVAESSPAPESGHPPAARSAMARHVGDTGVVLCLVRERAEAADGVIVLTLAPEDGGQTHAWEPGAHVDLVLGNDLTRQYSLCGDPADRDAYRVGVLREPAGRGGSAYVHDHLHVGAVVGVRGPRNHFALEPSPRYLFIAGGIGVTPIRAMVGQAERAGADWALTYGGRTLTSMAFLDELATYGERVTVWPEDERGLLDLDGLLGTPRSDTLVYVCGPAGLLAAVEERCAGWPDGALHVEHFTAVQLTEPVLDEAFEVELGRSGGVLVVPTDRSVVEVLREAGQPVLTSCSEGKCGTCEVGVLAGQVDHRDSVLTTAERAAHDRMMVCVSRSATRRLRLDL